MNSFTLAFSVVCPLFLLMALGYFLKKIKIFTEPFLKQLNSVCFKVFLPTILFINVYDSDFSKAFNPKLLLFAVVSILLIFFSTLFIVPKFEKNNQRCGVIVQGLFRSNFILFGLPISNSLFGKESAGTTAVLIAFIIPIFNVLAVVALEYFKGEKVNYKGILKNVIKNPLIWGALIAFVFVLSGIKLPFVLEETIRDVSNIATPLALIILGGFFTFSSVRPNIKGLSVAVIGRLIVVPLIFISISVAIGYRGVELGALLSMFACPTAVSSFIMAQQAKADDELAGLIVVIGSICSVVTIFFWITILLQLGLL